MMVMASRGSLVPVLSLLAAASCMPPAPGASPALAQALPAPAEPAVPAPGDPPATPGAPAPVEARAAEEAPWLRVFCTDASRQRQESCRIQGTLVGLEPAPALASEEPLARLPGHWLRLAPGPHRCRRIQATPSRPTPEQQAPSAHLRVLIQAPAALEGHLRQLLQPGAAICGASLLGTQAHEGYLETAAGQPLLAFSEWHTAQSDLLPGFAFTPSRRLQRRASPDGSWQEERAVILLRQGRSADVHQGHEHHFPDAAYWIRASGQEHGGPLPLRGRRGQGVRFELLALER